jgi:hypothetical protein
MNNDNPLIFRIPEETIKAYNRKYLFYLLGILVIGQLLFLGLSVYRENWPPGSTTLIVMGVLLVFFIISIIRNIRARTELLTSYAIVMDDLSITKKQKGKRDLTLFHGEIKSIQLDKKGNILVLGNTTSDSICVLRATAGMEELQRLLEEIQPIIPFKLNAEMWKILILKYSGYLSFLLSLFFYQQYPMVPLIALPINIVHAIVIFLHKQSTNRNKLFAVLRVIILIGLATYHWFGPNLTL